MHHYSAQHNDTKQRDYYYFWPHNIRQKDTLHYDNQFIGIQNNSIHHYDIQNNAINKEIIIIFGVMTFIVKTLNIMTISKWT